MNTMIKLNNSKNARKLFFFLHVIVIHLEIALALKLKSFPYVNKNVLTDLRNARKIVKCSVDIENRKTLHHRDLIKSNLKKCV